MLNIKKNDVWLIHFPVPYKQKKQYSRPFLVLENLNDQSYGIPITSFSEKRYLEELGDLIIDETFLFQKSIIKPYQGIYIKDKFFIKKVGIITSDVIEYINQKITSRSKEYLSLKNNIATRREFIIEKQTQKITALEQENQQLKLELELTKNNLLLNNNDLELE